MQLYRSLFFKIESNNKPYCKLHNLYLHYALIHLHIMLLIQNHIKLLTDDRTSL